jgi:hypothetical protein
MLSKRSKLIQTNKQLTANHTIRKLVSIIQTPVHTFFSVTCNQELEPQTLQCNATYREITRCG